MGKADRLMRGFLIILIALFILTGPAIGAEPPELSSEGPVEVTSKSMEALNDPRRVFFTGDAVARQGEVTIRADQLRVFFLGDSDVIKRIEAEGSVRIEQGERVATGKHGVMHQEEATIVLTGSPRISQGDDFVEGEEITVFLNENRSIVQGGDSSRVRAIFQPKDQKQ